jgi:outer membrane protein assembly factor BamB
MADLTVNQINIISNTITNDSDNQFTLLWKIPSSGSIVSKPYIANGTVYYGTRDGHSICAVDIKTRKEKWRFVAHNEAISSPIEQNGILYAGSSDGSLYAINAANGKLIWEKAIGVQYSSPNLDQNVIYIGGGSSLYAINASDGNIIWKYESRGKINSTAQIYKDKIIISSEDGNVYAINKYNGRLIWDLKVGTGYFPRIQDDYLYLGAENDDLFIYKIDPNNGKIVWKKTVTRNIDLSYYSVGADEKNVCIGSKDGTLSVFNVKNGKLLWKSEVGQFPFSPLIKNGIIYIGSGGA